MTVFLQTNGITAALDEPMVYAGATRYISGDLLNFSLPGGFTNPDQIYREQRAVRTVVNFIAHNAASVAIHGFKTDTEDERTRVKDGPTGATLNSPDRVATHYEFQRDVFKDVLLWEKFAAAKLRAEDGGLILMRIPPKLFRFDRSGTGRPNKLVIADEEFDLQHFFWMDGYPAADESPMAHLQDLLLEESESAKFRTNLWRRGALVGGVIERPVDAPDWSPAARRRFRSLLESRYSGNTATAAGGTMLLEDGMTYKQQDYMSSRDAQQIEARKLSTSEVAAAYQVPPVFVGVLDNANYSNVMAYRGMLYSDVLGPLFTQCQQAWTLRVGNELPDVDFFEHNVSEKLRLSFEEQATVLQSAVGAPYMTRAEARKRSNLPHLEGTDELIEPLNVSTGNEDPTPPTEEPQLEGSNDPAPDQEDDTNE
jgi:HK97 family phage portal protein